MILKSWRVSLLALGYEPTTTVDDANVILLNTCAIRENAENKVFGELGHLKSLKLEKPDLLLGFAAVCPRKNRSLKEFLRNIILSI